MTSQAEWNIQSRSDTCAATEAAFTDGQVIWSRLRHTEEGYVREDYSEEAWAALEDQGGLSVWQGVFHVPPPRAVEPLRKENAETLLRRLMESDDEQVLNTVYILAVMLERKRILVEQDVRVEEDGGKVRVYEHKQTGESFVIRDPELKLAELEKVQDEVVVMLGGTPPGQKPAGEEPAEQGGDPSGEESENGHEGEEENSLPNG